MSAGMTAATGTDDDESGQQLRREEGEAVAGSEGRERRVELDPVHVLLCRHEVPDAREVVLAAS